MVLEMSKSQFVFEVRSLEPGAKILSDQGYEGCFSKIRWKQKITIADFYVDAICFKFSLNKDDFLPSELLLQVGTEAFPDIGFHYADKIEFYAAEISDFIKRLSRLITVKSDCDDMFDEPLEFDCPDLIQLINNFLKINGDSTISSPLALLFVGEKVVELAGRFSGRPSDEITEGVFWLRGVEIEYINKNQRVVCVKKRGVSGEPSKVSISYAESQHRDLCYAYGDGVVFDFAYSEKLDAKGKKFFDLQGFERVG